MHTRRRPEGKGPLGRPRHRWEYNINMDCKRGCDGVDWLNLTQDVDSWQTFVNMVMKLKVP